MSPWELFSIVWIVMYFFTVGAIISGFSKGKDLDFSALIVLVFMSIVFWPVVFGYLVNEWITGGRD